MDYAYVISKTDLKILDILNVKDYTIALDSEFKGSSTVVLAKKPNVNAEDFLFLKHEDGTIFFTGKVTTFTNESGKNAHTITLQEIETIFDRKIFIDSEEIISTTGIEDFIKHEIEKEFSQSSDTILNMGYIQVVVTTHTKVLASVDTDNGIYNFKTFLGNAREYYGIFLDFEFSGSSLTITVSKKQQALFKFDASVSDIDNYLEDYSVDVLARLTVKWKIPDTETDGVTTVGATTILDYVLLSDRTISTNLSDPDRATGSINCIYIETDTEAGVTEEVINQFKSNSYEHSVTADVRRNSNIYPESQFYIGHECEIKTVSHGVKDSMITKLSYKRDSEYISVKFGNMAITLIEKLRKERS
ncbi:MAG: hypothetical protein PHC95_14610 [Parabacteroides sp.]|nr:hypothetical protein [Parabacteroides sp.]